MSRTSELLHPFFKVLRAFVCTVIIVFSAQPVLAEDMLELYSLAINRDPQFKGASYDRLALKETAKQVRARLTPDIRFEGIGGQIQQDIVSSNNRSSPRARAITIRKPIRSG